MKKWFFNSLGKEETIDTMKILLVDDHAILLDGLKKLIEEDTMLSVVAAVGNVPDAIRALDQYKPDLVITDYNLGDDNGLSLVQKSKRLFPDMKFIILSMHDEAKYIEELRQILFYAQKAIVAQIKANM
jgi:two-component system nitrate/nitrite response regulator NarL